MRSINFREANKILRRPEGMTEKKCMSLPVHTDGIECLSCWKMSFFERIKALIFGKTWVFVRSGSTQPPISLGCWKEAFLEPEKKDWQ